MRCSSKHLHDMVGERLLSHAWQGGMPYEVHRFLQRFRPLWQHQRALNAQAGRSASCTRADLPPHWLWQGKDEIQGLDSE